MSEKRLISNFLPSGAFDPLQNFETVTYTGNGGTQKITGYIRKGAAFNGSTSEIIADNPVVADTSYSISAWINITNTNTFHHIASVYGSTAATRKFIFRVNDDNGLQFITYDESGNTEGVAVTANSILPINTWHHVVAIDDGGDLEIFLNGSSVETDTGNSNSNTDATGNLNIGRRDDYSGSTNETFSGKIDQVRIFDKALSSAEVTTLYNETYDSSTKSTTDIFSDGSGVALYELDEDANSSNFGQAASFNGSSSDISLPFNLHNTAFSISFWAKNTLDSNNYYIVANNSGSTQAGWHIGGANGSGTKYNFRINNGSSNYLLLDSATVDDTNWHHVVVTWDNTTNANGAKIYINGSLSSQGTSTATTSFSFTNSTTQLMREPSGSLRSNGLLDQVRIYNTALSSGDVTKLYNESADVPTSGLVAHYKLDGDATDETGSYDGTASNVTYSTGVYGGTPTNVNFLGMAFKPDLVWIKNRDSSSYFHELHDSIRGASKGISSNSTIAEFTDANRLTSFDTNGFSVGLSSDTNLNNNDYVAWCWKAGGAAVSNTDGSITSSVSANPDAGFSIVKFTSPSSGVATIGTGLNQQAELVIGKVTNTAADWPVFVDGFDTTDYLLLNTTTSKVNHSSDLWNLSNWSSSLIGCHRDMFGTSNSVIAYCFHSVDGYQKVGSYTGNGSSNGPTITTGFKPRWIMVKATSDAGIWVIMDAVRDAGRNDFWYRRLQAESSAAEVDDFGSQSRYQILDTGFKLTNASNSWNGSGRTYIYLAIA